MINNPSFKVALLSMPAYNPVYMHPAMPYLAGYLKFPKIRQTKNGHTAFSGVIAVPMVITTKKNGMSIRSCRGVSMGLLAYFSI